MKRIADGSESGTFWVSFADMLTLLMIFFLYLFSISEINTDKLRQASNSINQEIDVKKIDKSESEKIKKLRQEKQRLAEMNTAISAYITENHLESVLSVNFWDDRLELNMGNALLFGVGDATLRPQAQDVLSKVGTMFSQSNSKIIVEGHTDDAPISTGIYPSNWELSSARAAAVVRFLSESGVNPSRFVVIGYNQYMPLVSNSSESNRAKNRRVKIVLKADLEHLKLSQQDPTKKDAHESI